jgi:hypothetical protein
MVTQFTTYFMSKPLKGAMSPWYSSLKRKVRMLAIVQKLFQIELTTYNLAKLYRKWN